MTPCKASRDRWHRPGTWESPNATDRSRTIRTFWCRACGLVLTRGTLT